MTLFSRLKIASPENYLKPLESEVTPPFPQSPSLKSREEIRDVLSLLPSNM